MNRRLSYSLWTLAATLAVALYAANFFLGEVNQDEGWYLYAARLVSEGQLPYVDFGFTQGPVIAYLYAAVWPLIERLGIAGGRLFTVLLGIAGCACAALLAVRLCGGEKRKGARTMAALSAFSLVGVNVYQSYFTTITKTYAATALFLTAGLLALTFVRRNRSWPALISGILLVLAAGCRTSVGVALPIAFLFLLYCARSQNVKADGPSGHRPWIWFGGGAVLTGTLVLLPYFLIAPRAAWFWLVEYHTARTAAPGLSWLVYKAGFVSRVVRAYFVASGLGLVMAVWHVVESVGPVKRRVAAARIEYMFWALAALVSVIHFVAPFPYDDYQVVVYPLVAALLAALLARRFEGNAALVASITIVILCGASAFSSARNQEWFVAGRDRMWWPLREEGALAKIQRAGRMIRELADSDGELLTQDTYLAVESGMRVPPGLEMGPFSYFPDMSRAEAEAYHVLNREMLVNLLSTTEAPVAALTGWAFAIQLPSVERVSEAENSAIAGLLLERYVPHCELAAIGQGDTHLWILLRKR